MVDKKITELTDYPSPIDTDLMPVVDITTATTKRITWANIKAALKTYWDTLYVALTGDQTVAGIKTFSSSPVFPSGTINAGDNLLLNPEFQVGATANLPLYWSSVGTPTFLLGVDTLFPALGGNQLTITATGAAAEGIGIVGATTNWLKVKPSTTYTISFYYKCTAGDSLTVNLRSYNGATEGTLLSPDVLTSTTATRYSYTFTTDVDATNLLFYLRATVDGDIVIVSHPKLEEGSVATPFEPCHARTRLTSKIIIATRNMAADSGDVSYTGLDFTPTSIKAIANIDATSALSIGFADSIKANVSIDQYGANIFVGDLTNLLHVYVDVNNHQRAIVKTYDANVGFTLTWNKVGSPTGIANLIFLCFR